MNNAQLFMLCVTFYITVYIILNCMGEPILLYVLPEPGSDPWRRCFGKTKVSRKEDCEINRIGD